MGIIHKTWKKSDVYMTSPYAIKKIINKTFSGRFMLSGLSHYPFIGRIIDFLLFKDDDIMYLPKDRTIPINHSLEGRSDLVLPSQILDRIIDNASHHRQFLPGLR